MQPLARDTPPEVEELILEGYRRMTPQEKIRRIVELNRAVEEMAAARIRAQYGPDLSERELQLRLASLRLERQTMVEVFGWDPEKKATDGPDRGLRSKPTARKKVRLADHRGGVWEAPLDRRRSKGGEPVSHIRRPRRRSDHVWIFQ